MYKRCRIDNRRIAARKRCPAGIFPRWITEKINIKEQFRKLLQVNEFLEETPGKPKPKHLSQPKDRPRPRPTVNDTVDDRPTRQPSGPESNSSPSLPFRMRRRKPSTKNLKYLGIYYDIRSRSTRESSHIIPATLGKVSLDLPVEPAQSRILPEEIMQHFPEESSDLKTVTLGKLPQVMKARRYKPTKYDRLLYKPRVEENHKTPPNLVHGETMVVVVRVYWPSYEKPEHVRTRRPPRTSQVIVMLGNQTLDQLRDQINCTADMILQKECSEDPRKVLEVTAKEAYKSGFFFINDAFYNDMRDPDNIDYSEVIRTWLFQKGLGHFDTHKMESTQMQELTVQLGYPYVYRHQGSCEHVLVISDIRLLNRSESQHMSDYPYVAYDARRRVKLCFMCGRYPSQWMTVNGSRVPYSPSYFCEKCFYSYNYIGEKKVGEFEAYKFTEPFYFP